MTFTFELWRAILFSYARQGSSPERNIHYKAQSSVVNRKKSCLSSPRRICQCGAEKECGGKSVAQRLVAAKQTEYNKPRLPSSVPVRQSELRPAFYKIPL